MKGIRAINSQMKMDKTYMLPISLLLLFFTGYAILHLSLPHNIKHSIKLLSSSSSSQVTVKNEVFEDVFSVLTSYNLKMEGTSNDEQYKNTLKKFKDKISEHKLESNIIIRSGFESTTGPSNLKHIEDYLNSNPVQTDHQTTLTIEVRNLKVTGDAHIAFYKFSQDSDVFGAQLFHIRNTSFDGDLTVDALSPFVLNGNSFKSLHVNYGIDITRGNNELGAAVSLLKDNYISGNIQMSSYNLSQYIQDLYWEKILEKVNEDNRIPNWRMRMYFKSNIVKGNANFQFQGYGLGTLEFHGRNEVGSLNVYDTVFFKNEAPNTGIKTVSLPLETDFKGNIREGIVTEVRIGSEEIIPANLEQYEKHRPFFLYLKKQAEKTGDTYYEQVYDRTLRRLSYPTNNNHGFALLDKVDRAMYYGHSILTPILFLFSSMSILALVFTMLTNFDFAYITTQYPQTFLRFLEFNWLDFKKIIPNNINLTMARELVLQSIYVASRLFYYPLITFGIVRTVQRFFL